MQASWSVRTGLILSLVVAGSSLSRAAGAPDWHPQNGGLPVASAAIWDLAVLADAPGTVLAALDSGLFRSRTHGSSWSLALAGSDQPSQQRLVRSADPRRVFLARRAHLYRSDDSGATWTTLPLPKTNADAVFYVQGIATDRSDARWVWVAGEKSGGPGGPTFVLSWSSNAGETWNDVPAPITTPNQARDLAVDPRRGGAVYLLAADGLYKSTNRGDTWAHRGLGLPENLGNFATLAIDPVRTRTLWVNTEFDGMFRSDNGGLSFAPANDGLPPWVTFEFEIGVGRAAFDGLDHERPYVSAPGAGVFRWSPDTRRWDALNGNLPVESVIQSLAIESVNGGRLFAGTLGRGVFRLDR